VRGGRGSGRKGLGIGREEKEVSEWSREGPEGRDGWDENQHSLYSKIASFYVMHAVYCKFTLYFDHL